MGDFFMKKLEENTERPYAEWSKKQTQVDYSENITLVIGSILLILGVMAWIVSYF